MSQSLSNSSARRTRCLKSGRKSCKRLALNACRSALVAQEKARRQVTALERRIKILEAVQSESTNEERMARVLEWAVKILEEKDSFEWDVWPRQMQELVLSQPRGVFQMAQLCTFMKHNLYDSETVDKFLSVYDITEDGDVCSFMNVTAPQEAISQMIEDAKKMDIKRTYCCAVSDWISLEETEDTQPLDLD